jgi:hypothetical protein
VRSWLAALVVAAVAAVVLVVRPSDAAADSVAGAAAGVHGVAVPRGTRADPEQPGRLISGKGYRDTAEQLVRWLDRAGIAFRRVGPYRVRGVDVMRLLSEDAATPWLAIHVWRRAGTTWITVVPRPS